ncbi:hypothetical protein TSUD_325000 [Trifolium subterraneum]|uniref:Transposase MuDR plant domain-containing protein n=1 Tax=Trifolium subterraneum TaxID=3900 RepID=A0A2Z6NPX5_TRISU|nr:hypothetical protein TSUD_325000 [Trifolium subterraneum]
MSQGEDFSYDDYGSAVDSVYRPSLVVETDSEEETPNDVHTEVNNKGKSTVVVERNQKNKKKRAIREDDDSSSDVSYEVDPEQRQMINLEDVREENEDGNDSYHSEELKSPISTDDEDDSGKRVYPQFNEAAKFGDVHIELGMEFGNLETFKAAVGDYTIDLGRVIKWVKNDKKRARVKCKEPECPWEIFCSWSKDRKSYQVKTFHSKHVCGRKFQNKQATRKWVVKQLTEKVDTIPIPEAVPQFRRFYVCLDACKRGFNAGCRPFIGLDGCFLKGYYGGQLLSAFLTLLHDDLGDYRQNGWNFMSDMQKGLIPAMQEVMPGVPHRYCALHMWRNFTKQWKDKELREEIRCYVMRTMTNNRLKLEGRVGIPCKHACAAISWKNENPEEYCNGWLGLASYKASYEFFIQLVRGETYWEPTPFTKPVPPWVKRIAGRPKKNRRRDETEVPAGSGKVKRTLPDFQ